VEAPDAETGSRAAEGGQDLPFVASPWFTLTSQWRLGALVALLVLALIGVNWGIVAVFHGPLGKSVLLGDNPASRPTERKAAVPSRGSVTIAGASVPVAAERAGGWIGNPRQAIDAARNDLKTARQELEPETAETLQPDKPIKAICATTYAGPSEIGRVVQAARQARAARTQNASLASVDRPNGRIRVEVRHRMKGGRLIVLVDGRTVLSKPFEAVKGKSGTVTHVLSVPAGRHGVEVRLLEDKGGLLVKSKITGTVTKNEIALLTGEQRSTGNKNLKLDWQDSH